MIRKDVVIGKNTKIYNPHLVNLYGCHIGDDCIIGTFVEIQSACIGNKVKIQAFAFIPNGVTIEDGVFIGPHVCFTNDLYPRSTTKNGGLKEDTDWKIRKTKVCNKASIGANATILCGIVIGEGAMVGAGSVVVKNVEPWTIVVGNPAKPIGNVKEKT